MKRVRFINCVVLGRILAIAVVAMTGENAVSQVANPPGSVAANGEVAPNDLRAPVRETPEKLVAAIQQGALWQHLSHFQTIADQSSRRRRARQSRYWHFRVQGVGELCRESDEAGRLYGNYSNLQLPFISGRWRPHA